MGACSSNKYLSQPGGPSIDPSPPTGPAGPTGAQRTLDSSHNNPRASPKTRQQDNNLSEGQSADSQVAFPTESKEREKARRKREKELGIERTVKKKLKIVEEHYDDCGYDMSSINIDETMLCMPCGCDTDEALSEEDGAIRLQLWNQAHGQSSYAAVGWNNIKYATPGGSPAYGPDPRAPP